MNQTHHPRQWIPVTDVEDLLGTPSDPDLLDDVRDHGPDDALDHDPWSVE